MARFTKLNAAGKPVKPDAKSWASVLDNATGLIWMTKSIKVANHAAGVEAIRQLKPVGESAWRMPTVEELFPLADRSRRSPAIDTEFFPDTKNDWYWSSSPVAGYPGFAWYVDFYDGYSDWGNRGTNGFVRAVRGPVLAGQ